MSLFGPKVLLLSVGLLLFVPKFGSATETCKLAFTFEAGKEIGTVVIGDVLSGTIDFAVTQEMRLDSETRSYFVDGLITLSGTNAGQVSAAVVACDRCIAALTACVVVAQP